MPRLTKIYTRTGDDGQTGLGDGRRVDKTDLRIAAYGTVDELNSAIGVALAAGVDARVAQILRRIQNELFHLGADLCVPDSAKVTFPVPRIEPRHVAALEADMDSLAEALPALENFILPGGSLGAAHLQLARTICRRAERDVLQLAENEPIGAPIVPYLNRLSDTLFVLARFQNHSAGIEDPLWDSRA